MSEEILQPAIDKFAEGDLEGAVQMLDDMCKTTRILPQYITPMLSLRTCLMSKRRMMLFPEVKS